MMRSRSALHRQWPSLVAAAAALFVFACHEEPNEGDDIARLAAMKQEILHLVGDAACNEPKDCRAIGLGAKPCGGPWEYLVYSRSSVDEATLQDLVARYNVFNEVLNRRYGWTSDCRVATPPPVNCVDGHCAAVQPGLAGTWDLIGYADHGVEGSASGTATFAADGTFTITGQVTYPGEPTDPLELGGTYVFAGDRVELTKGGRHGDVASRLRQYRGHPHPRRTTTHERDPPAACRLE